MDVIQAGGNCIFARLDGGLRMFKGKHSNPSYVGLDHDEIPV